MRWQSPLRFSKTAFTLVELLVVIGIIGLLVAMAIPAVQRVRAASRRATCLNHLKQIGLAALNYESNHQHFPANDGRPGQSANGASWMVALLPYLEAKNIYDSLEFNDTCFSDTKKPNRNARLIDGVQFPVFSCPSSPLDRFRKQTPHPDADYPPYTVAIADYVGNCGYYYVPGTGETPNRRSDSRLNVWNGYGWLQNAGVITTDNIVYNPVKMAEITDGTSHTIAVGENSDWMRDVQYEQLLDARSGRSAGGMWTGGEGWVRSIDQVEPVTVGSGGYTANITAIRFPNNSPRFYDRTGYTQFAPNALHTGYRSAHAGGVQFVFADGSVHFVDDDVDLMTVMMALSGRNDAWPGKLLE